MKINSLIQHFLTTVCPPCIPPSSSPPLLSSRLNRLYFLLRKEQTFKRQQPNIIKKDSIRQGKSSPTKVGQGIQQKRAVKRVRDTPSPRVRVPQKYQANSHNIHRGPGADPVDPMFSASVSRSLCQLGLADSVNHALLMSSMTSDSYSLCSSVGFAGLLALSSKDRDPIETTNLDSPYNICLWASAPICCQRKPCW